MKAALLALLLAACGGPAEDAGDAAAPAKAPAKAPAEPASPAKPAPKAAGQPAEPRVWTLDTIDRLQPVRPTDALTVPVPLEATPAIERTMERLGGIVDRWASDPDNPWAMGHGIMARGIGFAARDGTPAVDLLFSRYAALDEVRGHTLIRFPKGTLRQRIQPHADQMLKLLTEVNADPNRAVVVEGRTFLLADLYRATVVRSYIDPARNHASYASPNDVPWSLQALAAWAPPDLRWVAVDGTPASLDALTSFTAIVLDKESAFMVDAMKAGADFEKKGQGIFAYTCGGAHLLQGTAYAVARGFGRPEDRAIVEAQVPLLFYRLPHELQLYDETAQDNPEHGLRLLAQRLKFTGHWLESMEKLAAMGFYTPDEEQQRLLAGAATQIALTVEGLNREGAWRRLPEIEKQDYQLYLDLVGDSAHALHGLRIALGRDPVWL